ncbi:NADPH-dependent FMN reductase [Acetobacter sp. DsW_063]|uniref:NADPH-dependent FMN reductase n=1 Tax=Acetobacter sp. DsW_063 TaxID=1514894 RepID=UPI000A39DF58|nr:NADPH-dependent FMN reductase [Acetobacter sp. DsW_063]
MGSVRSGRRCPEIAEWIATIGRVATGAEVELVDLRDWHLPMDDELFIPALGDYVQEHSLAWSQKVANASACVFVTPQYNWGYPAALKNAIDHCYNEWRGKPMLAVTYGGHGGGKCGAQLLQVAEGLKMRAITPFPELRLSEEVIRGGVLDVEREFGSCRDAVVMGFEALLEAIWDPESQ